jgi:Gly-Xaa carboxypeptidase
MSLTLSTDNESKSCHSMRLKKPLMFAALALAAIASITAAFSGNGDVTPLTPQCPPSPKAIIREHEKIQYILHDPEFRNHSASVLSGAIQIDTVVYDIMPDYSKFENFHAYLKETFPNVYSKATIHKVNDYGLVFEFKGTNSELKPIMLTAHQDTVPIGDPSDWTEDPFGGRYDGEKVFGRGAMDCKNLLIGIMEAMELRIIDGKDTFKRGILLAFGFDEEKSGFDGAKHIGEFLVDYLGEDSVYFLMDEGMQMFTETMGDYYGMVITGEKGYTDLSITINTSGGHSSNPRDHTSIGIMSYFLTSYEDEIYQPVLDHSNPMLKTFQCAAEQGHIDDSLKSIIQRAAIDPKANAMLLEYISNDPMLKYTVQTSQAIDIVDGGDKANALPRLVKAMINHRITYGNSPETIFGKAIKYGKLTAKKYDIGLTVHDKVIFPETENGNMVIDYFGELLPTARISPTDEVWEVVTGNMRAFYEDEVFPELFSDSNSDKKYIIAPSLMTPNTDTRHYWNVTKNIYKVQPGSINLMEAGPHGPDEWIPMQVHLEVIAFYYNLFSDVCQDGSSL